MPGNAIKQLKMDCLTMCVGVVSHVRSLILFAHHLGFAAAHAMSSTPLMVRRSSAGDMPKISASNPPATLSLSVAAWIFDCDKALVGNAVVLFDSCISYVLLMCCADVSFVCTSMLMDMICLLVEAHETHPDLKSKGVKYIADQMRTETFKEDFEDAVS